MKIEATVAITALTILSGCAISTVTYNVKSTPAPAKIEVNGRERCAETPCSIELKCKAGLYGASSSPVFMAAFPLAKNEELHPQSAMKNICTKDVRSEEVIFDLNQPKIGDFESGSHVPYLLKKYFSL